MIAFASLIAGMLVLAAAQHLVRAARRLARAIAQRRHVRQLQHQPFGLPAVAAPNQPQAVRVSRQELLDFWRSNPPVERVYRNHAETSPSQPAVRKGGAA